MTALPKKITINDVEYVRADTLKKTKLPFKVRKADEGIMNWYDAMKPRPDGWRLPTAKELNMIYENKDKIGGLNLTGSNPAGWYWSSSPNFNDGYARIQRFSDGHQYHVNKTNGLSVRLVRSLDI